MAGRNTAMPLFRRMTSCSCSHSRARSISLAWFLTSLLRVRSDVTAVHAQQLAQGRLASEQVRAPGSLWQRGEQVFHQPLGGSAAQLRGLHQRPPLALQRHLEGFGVPSAHTEASAAYPPSPRPSAARLRTIRRRRSGSACT